MDGLILSPFFRTAQNDRCIANLVLARYSVDTSHSDILRRETQTEHRVKTVAIRTRIPDVISDCELSAG